MAKLDENDHYPIVEISVALVLLRLASRPESKPFVADLQVKYNAMQAAQGTYRAAQLVCMSCTLDVNYQDELVNGAFMAISRRLHDKVGGNRQSAVWKKLYREAPSKTIEPMATPEKLREIERVLETITTDDDFKDLRELVPPVEAALVGLAEAKATREEALAAEGKAEHQRGLAVDACRKGYNRLHHELPLLYEDKPAMVRFHLG